MQINKSVSYLDASINKTSENTGCRSVLSPGLSEKAAVSAGRVHDSGEGKEDFWSASPERMILCEKTQVPSTGPCVQQWKGEVEGGLFLVAGLALAVIQCCFHSGR